uniref:Uncharacterized protein n=1 Tax=Glossina pallidipes TaxID=7398 RepID=A0A1A9ZBN2_GLOPL
MNNTNKNYKLTQSYNGKQSASAAWRGPIREFELNEAAYKVSLTLLRVLLTWYSATVAQLCMQLNKVIMMLWQRHKCLCVFRLRTKTLNNRLNQLGQLSIFGYNVLQVSPGNSPFHRYRLQLSGGTESIVQLKRTIESSYGDIWWEGSSDSSRENKQYLD